MQSVAQRISLILVLQEQAAAQGCMLEPPEELEDLQVTEAAVRGADRSVRPAQTCMQNKLV